MKKGIIIIVATIIIIIWGLFSTVEMVIIRYWGVRTKAIVTTVPTDCDRYNRIKVLILGNEQEIAIGRNACKEGRCKVGQEVELLKHKSFNQLVWPGSHPELVIIIMLGIFILVYITARKNNR